ncbi:aldehyde dehydrogenase family protein [Amycolatopsis echigonensis]|uniref:Aldehyde dehydrogenase n=1 Tax=Amycolatopsis echigonensis TaxID=2576905 RepID=A0A8E1W883_9PSEU|nr:aldehyde dehydrogenase family protein [Amycolatopsis echigonensis]
MPAPAGSSPEPAVDRVVAGLRQTFASGRTRSHAWRVRQLRAIERLLDERESEIAAALGEDLGRPPAEAWLGDIASTKAEATFARKRVGKWMKKRRTGLSLSSLPGRAWYQYEPLGTVLIIGPWNYPVYLSLGPLVAAVAAGNCAVVKPSEHAPASSALLARLIPQYLDPDAIAVVEGEAEVTQDLLAQGFDHAFFTGGTEIGKLIMSAAAPHLTPVTLELGGKSPVIVTRHADIEVAARRVAWVKLMNSGQTCIAPDYVLVDRSVREEFVNAVVKTIGAFRVDEAGTLRIVNRRQFDRVAALIEQADGVIACGGGTDAERLGIEPTVIVDPSPDSDVMAAEIFGPVLPVLTVDSLDEAISFVNARPKPLATYLFSKDFRDRDRVLDEVSSGGAVVNHVAMHCLEPHLPFGGVGDSGMGAYHGRWGFETFSHRKAVLAKPSRPDPAMVYPPYTEKKLKLMRRVF